MKVITTQLGDLKARFVGDDDAPSLLVCFCHGYGAPGTDLVGLAQELVTLRPELAKARFVFPEAPLVPDGMGPWGGRAWWQIDLMALQDAIENGKERVLADSEPDGLASARKKLMAALELALAQAKLPWSRLVLGGFSQGAMLAVDTALRADEPAAQVIAFSPTLLCEAVWQRYAEKRRGLPVFISHGKVDPLLPFRQTEALVTLLTDAGLVVDFVPFMGPHTIAFEGLERAAEHLAALTAREPG